MISLGHMAVLMTCHPRLGVLAKTLARGSAAYIVMAYVVMVYVVMAYVVMAYIVMAYIFMAYIVMASPRPSREGE